MKNILILLLVFLLFSCGSKDNSLLIVFKNTNGLKEGNPVLIKGIEIGKVSKISLNKQYKINVEIILNDTIQFPKDSKFTIGSKDLFTRAILVSPGKMKSYLSSSDIIIGLKEQNTEFEHQLEIVTNKLNNSKFVRNQNSIIAELRKINWKIESVETTE
jgi:ABC-type transporter Mla subunit MlaD